MLLADASMVLAGLKAAFPTMALDEEQTEVLLREIVLLHDPSIMAEATANLIHREDKFPSIARIRSAYRSVAERRELERRALKAAEPSRDLREIPTWVHVWQWERQRTEHDRQSANDKTNLPKAERNPVQMRDFPQLIEASKLDREMEWKPSPSGAYSWDEYAALEREWREAGCPSVGQVSELLEKVGA